MVFLRKRAEWLPAAAAVLLPVAVGLVFFYAPEERTMGLVQKIFYFHLSLAAAAFLSFLVACGAGVAYLVKRERRWDALGAASVEVGVLFTSLVLVTGSLWGRPIWNTWWTWDPRLTTSLILWFIYAACLILRTAVEDESKRATYTAVMAIVGFMDVPIVFLSARLFRSIHPTVLRSDSVGLESSMVATLLVSLAAMLLLGASLVRLRCSLFMQEAAIKDLQTRLEM
ncbi:MAG: cytochrome c biogenesis protein [Candidatus Geothermincolia bacterium]